MTRRAGIDAIGLWREPVAEVGLEKACGLVAGSGLRVSTMCRGGFFTPAVSMRGGPRRRRARDRGDGRAGSRPGAGSAPVLVLVAGGLPDGDRDLAGARLRAADAIGEPSTTPGRPGSCWPSSRCIRCTPPTAALVFTLGQALDIAEQFPAEPVGVVVDTYHVWWDPSTSGGTRPCPSRRPAGGRIASYQVADWLTPLGPDVLLSRGLPGYGHIDLSEISAMIAEVGYDGDVEVEVFNQGLWDTDPLIVANRTAATFRRLRHPELSRGRARRPRLRRRGTVAPGT